MRALQVTSLDGPDAVQVADVPEPTPNPGDVVVEVKAVTPDLDGNAIGGSINIVTRSAFDRAEPFLNGSVSVGYNDFSGDWGYRPTADPKSRQIGIAFDIYRAPFQTTTQKIIISVGILSSLGLLVFSALDYRFGWSRVPPLVSLLGDVLVQHNLQVHVV